MRKGPTAKTYVIVFEVNGFSADSLIGSVRAALSGEGLTTSGIEAFEKGTDSRSKALQRIKSAKTYVIVFEVNGFSADSLIGSVRAALSGEGLTTGPSGIEAFEKGTDPISRSKALQRIKSALDRIRSLDSINPRRR